MMGLLAVGLMLPILLMTAGCADSVYYQTRYSPAGADPYSLTERLFWTEDPDVYETPANPPALATDEDGDDAHRSRVACRKLGPSFKPDTLFTGDGTEIRGHSRPSPTALARMDDTIINPPLPPDRPQALAAWHTEPQLGARERTGLIPVAGYDSRTPLMRGSGIDVREPIPLASMRDDEGWCPPARR